jgi:hypothetical protein
MHKLLKYMRFIILNEALRSLIAGASRRTPKQHELQIKTEINKNVLDLFPLYADRVLNSVRRASLHIDFLPCQNNESNTPLV